MSAWGGRRVTALRRHLWATREHTCWRCDTELVWPRFHVGHRIDRANGGTDTPDNLAPECLPCNLAAGGHLGHARRGLTATTNPRRDWTQ